jgi:hypothetical protein
MKTPFKCPYCDEGMVDYHNEDYTFTNNEGDDVCIPQVFLLKCDKCPATLIPSKTGEYISSFETKRVDSYYN